MAKSDTVSVVVRQTDTVTSLDVTVRTDKTLVPPAAQKIADVTLSSSTTDYSLPFPNGVTTATYVWVRALTGMTDMTVRVGLSDTALSIPEGAAMPFYNVTAVYVSSTAGGRVQYAIAG